MTVVSFKLRFFDEHVRIGVGSPAGVDVRGADARACFELARPIVDWVLAREPGLTVRALSVDLVTRRVLVSLQDRHGGTRPSVVRVDAPDSSELLERAAPVVARLVALATDALEKRSKAPAH